MKYLTAVKNKIYFYEFLKYNIHKIISARFERKILGVLVNVSKSLNCLKKIDLKKSKAKPFRQRAVPVP